MHRRWKKRLTGAISIFLTIIFVSNYALIGLLVDSEFRCRYVATTLLKAMALQARQEGNTLYLHADPEDTPKDLYARMGFETLDRVYEYLCTDLSRLSLGEEQKPSYTEHDGSSI